MTHNPLARMPVITQAILDATTLWLYQKMRYNQGRFNNKKHGYITPVLGNNIVVEPTF